MKRVEEKRGGLEGFCKPSIMCASGSLSGLMKLSLCTQLMPQRTALLLTNGLNQIGLNKENKAQKQKQNQ